MSELMEATRQELLDRLEVAESDEEFAAIEAALGHTLSGSESTWIVTTLADVAEFFAVHEATVKGWRREGLPGAEGRYDLSEMVAWRIAKAEKRGLGINEESDRALLREKTRIAIERQQLALDQEKGLLGRKDELAAEVTEAFALVRVRFEAAPAEMITNLPADIRDATLAEWRDKVRLVLMELAAVGLENDGDVATTNHEAASCSGS